MILFSFDHHSTLRFSLVPGPVTIQMLRDIQQDNVIIASSLMSYPMVVELRRKGITVKGGTWKIPSIMKDFKKSIDADRYIHVSNSRIDRMVARRAGFEYWTPEKFVKWYRSEYT